MKRRMISVMLAFIMVLSMLFGVTPTVHATEAEGTKTFENVTSIYTYCYYDEEDNITATMLLMDGDTVLTEGKDYTVSVTYNEDEEGYKIVATGMGEYQSDSYTDYGYTVYSLHETDEWKYIVNYDEEEDCTWTYLVSYIGNEASVTIPEYIGDGDNEYYVDGIKPGTFTELDHVTAIDTRDLYLPNNIIVNCSNLAQLTISCADDMDAMDLIIGSVAEDFNITAPSDLNLWDGENDTTLSIEDYCKKNGYNYTDKYAYYSEDGFNYKINGNRAEVLSYTGTDTEAVVPNSIEYNEETVYVEYLYSNAFSDLPYLTSISLGDVDFGLPLCENCPALESISSTVSNQWWYTSLTDSPSKDITIYTYPDAVWWYDDEATGEEIQGTIQDYCEKYGYSYGELEKSYTVLDVILSITNNYDYMDSNYNSMRLISGTEAIASLCVDTKEEGYVSIDPQDITWESKNNDVLTIDQNGFIIVDNVDETTTVELVATTTFAGKEQEKSVSVFVLPRLVKQQEYYFVTDSPTTMLPCQYRDYVLYEEEIDGETYEYNMMEPVDMPESFTASYESADISVAVVNEDGTIQAAEGAEIGSTTTIVVTYTDGTETYTTTVDVEVGETSEVPFELPSTDGEAINVYSWNEEASSRIQYFLQMYPQYEGLINFYTISNMNNAYYEGVLEAFNEEGKEPDIILREADAIADGLSRVHIVDLKDIGFDESWYANAYPYTKAIGSQNGELKAVSWQSNPGCFMYRTDIAEKVFGTSDPEEIQKLVADWDSFMETAKTLKEAGYDIISGVDDVNHPMLFNRETPWASDNVMNMGIAEQYLEISKALADNDYTAGTTSWSEEWQANADGNVFGYFGCEWFLNYSFFPEEHKDDYRICEGPDTFAWGGSWMSVTNTGHNDELIKFLLYSLTCDENLMYRIARGTGDFMNNREVCQRMYDEGRTTTDRLNNQNPYPMWMKVAESIPATEATLYDLDMNIFLTDAVEKMNDDEEEIASVAEAIEYIKSEIQKKYPDLLFEAVGHKHTFSDEWTIDKAATCIAEGSKSHHCTGCTEVTDVTVIPVTGKHTYNNGVIQKLPTCADKGTKVYMCTVCKQTKSEEIVATGSHVYGDWVETKAATVDEEGEKTRTCTTCAHQETEAIAATGHVKGASFEKGNAEYTIDTVKGKKGTVTYEGSTKDNAKKITVPSTVTIDGKKYTVTEVADNAFKGNTKVKEVTVSKNITKIGKNAFSGCKNLKKITIKSSKLKSIGKNALKNVKKDATIKVPKKQYSKYKKMLTKKKTGYKKTMKIKK